VSNLIIVESESDQAFIEVMIEFIGISNEIECIPIAIDNFKCLYGAYYYELERRLL